MCKKRLSFFSIKDISFYNNQCGNLHKMSQLKINQIIEKEINKFKPNIIFTHTDKDLNSDHKTIHKSVLVATRPVKIKIELMLFILLKYFLVPNGILIIILNQIIILVYQKDILQKWAALRFTKVK